VNFASGRGSGVEELLAVKRFCRQLPITEVSFD